ncbi:hypothetical protein CCACVL1_24999 [Corchorus capsularis]|uniref:F-box domain-containing protein n=1 Tax=Corchorus capsularis TaxID=210143 RepID=A0A1R3GMD1_COCAP|nr:hypothetical protein CCACVL1_24999 [Corchorus capsularis]
MDYVTKSQIPEHDDDFGRGKNMDYVDRISIPDSGSSNVSSESQIAAQDDDYGDYGNYGDRISELPDDILLQILSYLPTWKDIIATCVLSSRWKSLWKSLWESFDVLNFDFKIFWTKTEPMITWDSVQRAIEEIPDRARIGKFRLHCDASVLLSAATKKRTELNSMLSKLVRHQVEVLDLYICPEWERFRFFPWPDSLCTSGSLTTLKLDMSLKLHLPASICFPKLKTLHLECIKFHQEHDPERLFSACPILEELHFRRCDLISNPDPPNYKLSISIPSLRRFFFEHTYKHISLRINCSNLHSLKFRCFKFELLECNLPSLVEAHIDFGTWQFNHQLFERICHIKSLGLPAQTIQGLIFEYFEMEDGLTVEDVVSFYFNRSLKSLNLSKFHGNGLEVNVRFHESKFVSIWHVATDVRFVGKILENADVLEKLIKMELVKRKVYIKDKLSSFSYADCDLFL